MPSAAKSTSSDLPCETDALLSRARALAPAIGARWDEAERRRDIPAESIAELRAAGLTRLFQPKRWGGFEADPRLFFDLQNIISAECASTAWVLGVLNVQSLVLALFDDRAQAAVWGADPEALVSSSFMPKGKAEPVDGGYRLSGRWSYSSGAGHAQWAMVGGRTITSAGTLETRIFLLPRADYEVIDVWNAIGMRGTGSNDIAVTDMFVPA